MGRMYAAAFEDVAVTAAQDLFEIQPADDEKVTVHALYLTQTSDFGDSEEEGLLVKIVRGNSTPGSGGTVLTPAPMDPKVGAAASTVDRNNTTEASAGTEEILHLEAINVRVGLAYIPTPESRPQADQGNTTLCVRLIDAPADSLTMSGLIIFEEG